PTPAACCACSNVPSPFDRLMSTWPPATAATLALPSPQKSPLASTEVVPGSPMLMDTGVAKGDAGSAPAGCVAAPTSAPTTLPSMSITALALAARRPALLLTAHLSYGTLSDTTTRRRQCRHRRTPHARHATQ